MIPKVTFAIGIYKMSDDDSERPPDDSPELMDWLRKKHASFSKEIFGENYQASDFDERDLVSGDINDLHKNDAELFPDEIEEYTPEERRKSFKVHKRDDTKKS